ncbi:glycoside hydrolase domain-containing protein [Nocardioides massiliensis]|uniref:Peptidoglycan hydrolase-like protein with peptidoglycan-binding domain n=1 Tax=Nocardioides massiliensis TaxID=1325935 RepID=A0ABT9NP11_9ACTN|nr:glycoside hydrolase domain-containing protein [Nocardioides massiliensis]MDP9821600.1 peptidoglycan hydrolase-like protein with peptidoglycan-binding domain [Nocardioides massiliensis]
MSLSPSPRLRRLLAAALGVALAVPALSGGSGAPHDGGGASAASAAVSQSSATRAMPGRMTGYVFDQCQAPSQAAMDAWWESSPYRGIGIYIAGDNRYCADQLNLDATWVKTQAQRGWALFPIVVGRQAACSPVERYADRRISPKPADDYAAARAQAAGEAQAAVDAAKLLGIGARSVLWFDLEAFPTTKAHCRESALAFLSSWTKEVRRLGYRSGVYSSAASGIALLDQARRAGRHTMPDRLWVAEWVPAQGYRVPPTATPPTFASAFYDHAWWSERGRVMRQYRGDHDETHGGVRINIDTNYTVMGAGTRVPPQSKTCRKVIDHARYRPWKQGDVDPEIRAAQCLLRVQGHYRSPRFRPRFTKRTEVAVRRFQTAVGLPATGRLTRPTWVALHSAGPGPVSKYGSGSHAVRRLQRALKAAGTPRLPVTGYYGYETTQAVRAYQKRVGLPVTGVAGTTTWLALRAGRR